MSIPTAGSRETEEKTLYVQALGLERERQFDRDF